MSGDLRVLMICSWYLKYTASLATRVSQLGVPVALLCRDAMTEFADQQTEWSACLDGARGGGVDVLVLSGRSSQPSAYAAALRTRRLVSGFDPTVVHVQDNYDPRLLMCGRSDLPRIVTIHDPIPHPGQAAKPPWRAAIRRRWLASADTIIVHGERLRAELGPIRSHVVVVPHGADTEARPYDIPERPCVLLFGRLEPYKGLADLQDAMQHVWLERPDVRLLIAGTGQSAGEVRNDPRIEFRNRYVPESGLAELFAEATLVALPYTQASQSGVATLAVARGVPTVVTSAGALSEFVSHQKYVVPPGDVQAISARILALLDHDYTAREAVLAHAQRAVSWASVAAKHIEVYNGVLARAAVA